MRNAQPVVILRPKRPPPGKDGEHGKAGESAYQIACRNGFTGTELAFLDSLKAKEVVPVVVQPMPPTHAIFERDDITSLTERLRVFFPSGEIDIIPQRDGEGFMTAATFVQV